MKPPEDRPDTVILAGSTSSAGSATTAWAEPAANAAAATHARTDASLIGCLLHAPIAGARRNPAQPLRLFLMGTSISSGLISCTSSGTPHVNAGSALILKW